MNGQRLVETIAGCWSKAEATLQERFSKVAIDADEEYLTRRFYEELSLELMRASDFGEISRAFADDLADEYSSAGVPLEPDAASHYTRELVASVVLHHKGTEKKTGGDLGVVLVRPVVPDPSGHGLSGDDFHRSGALIQAKLRDTGGKWSELTTNQKKVLKARRHFSSLLLYSFADPERQKLNSFAWQPLNSATNMKMVAGWLANSCFPSLSESTQFLHKLAGGGIGTQDPKEIETNICPKANTVLHVQVDWPDGQRPEATILTRSRIEVHEPEEVRIYLTS